MMGKRRQKLGMVGLALVVALVAAACGGGDDGNAPATPSGGTAERGGVYRTALSNFDFTQGFDPTAEYLGLAFDFYQALVRNLVSYKHVAGAEGNKLYRTWRSRSTTWSPRTG